MPIRMNSGITTSSGDEAEGEGLGRQQAHRRVRGVQRDDAKEADDKHREGHGDAQRKQHKERGNADKPDRGSAHALYSSADVPARNGEFYGAQQQHPRRSAEQKNVSAY